MLCFKYKLRVHSHTVRHLMSPSWNAQARVHVPDERFKWLCSTYKPKSEVPAFLDIVDIAGLVK